MKNSQSKFSNKKSKSENSSDSKQSSSGCGCGSMYFSEETDEIKIDETKKNQ